MLLYIQVTQPKKPMTITNEDIVNAQQAKEQIEDALCALQDIARRSEHTTELRFGTNVVGAIEHACDNFTGMGNYSITCFIHNIQDEIEDA